jgi:hypothetical protein
MNSVQCLTLPCSSAVAERRHDATLGRLQKSRLRLMRKWWTKRLVALAILYFGNALRSWVRTARARLLAARTGSECSSQDVELPNASVPTASTMGQYLWPERCKVNSGGSVCKRSVREPHNI